MIIDDIEMERRRERITDVVIGIICVVLGISLVFCLAGCDFVGEETGAGDASTIVTKTEMGAHRFTIYDQDGDEHYANEDNIFILQDNQTGVRYLVLKSGSYRYGYTYSLTPLLDSDGNVEFDPEKGE